MFKKMKCIIAFTLVSLLFLNTGCSLFKKKDNSAIERQAALQAEDSSMQKFISDFIVDLYKKPLSYYQKYNESGTIPTELWEYISKDTITLCDRNPESSINYPRPLIINSLVLGNYDIIMDGQEKGKDGTPEINSEYIGQANGVSTYLVTVNLKVKCINTNDVASMIKSTMDMKTAQTLFKAAVSEDFSGVSDAVLTLIKNKALGEMYKNVDKTNKLDYIKVQIKYDVDVKKEDGSNKIVSFEESEKVKGNANRLSLYNNLSVKRIDYLDTADNEDDKKTFSNETKLITGYFNLLCSTLDNNKMKLMAKYWNTSNSEFIGYMERISPSDKKAKNLVDMMYIAGDYKTKFPYDSLPILTNMEKISGGLSNVSIKMHPAYSEKRKEYIVSFQAPVQKINGSIAGYTTNCYYDYSVSLTGKGDNLKISRMIMNEHYYVG